MELKEYKTTIEVYGHKVEVYTVAEDSTKALAKAKLIPLSEATEGVMIMVDDVPGYSKTEERK